MLNLKDFLETLFSIFVMLLVVLVTSGYIEPSVSAPLTDSQDVQESLRPPETIETTSDRMELS